MKLLACFLLTMAILLSVKTEAQFNKGTRIAGVNIASAFFNSGNADQAVTSIGSTTSKTTSYGINITPSVGWFLSENTAAGFLLSLAPSGNKISYQENGSTFQRDNSNNFNIGIGGFARNYFHNSGSWLPFVQVSIDAGISNIKQDGFFYGGSGTSAYKETYTSKSSGGFFMDAIFTGGCTKMVADNIGLDLYIGYNFSYSKNTMSTTHLKDNMIDGTIDETAKNETTTKITNHKFMLGLGFQIFLPKKKK